MEHIRVHGMTVEAPRGACDRSGAEGTYHSIIGSNIA